MFESILHLKVDNGNPFRFGVHCLGLQSGFLRLPGHPAGHQQRVVLAQRHRCLLGRREEHPLFGFDLSHMVEMGKQHPRNYQVAI